jgi:hypothetical protein
MRMMIHARFLIRKTAGEAWQQGKPAGSNPKRRVFFAIAIAPER